MIRAGLCPPSGSLSTSGTVSHSFGSHPPGAAQAVLNMEGRAELSFYVLAADLGSDRLRRPRAPCIQQAHRHLRSSSEPSWACVSATIFLFYLSMTVGFVNGWEDRALRARFAYSLSFDPVFTQLEHVEIASPHEGPPEAPRRDKVSGPARRAQHRHRPCGQHGKIEWERSLRYLTRGTRLGVGIP
jgi:hypothetical protein